MAKKRTPPAEPTTRAAEPKKRKQLFKTGDFVQNVEDPSIIIVVTKDMDKTSTVFHGTCIAAAKRQVGEHERFWISDRFKLIKLNIEVVT